MKDIASFNLSLLQEERPKILIIGLLPRGYSVKPIENTSNEFQVAISANSLFDSIVCGRVSLMKGILLIMFDDSKWGRTFKKDFLIKYPEFSR